MERVGLRFDLPGLRVDDPEAVATAGLTHLEDGPVWVMPGNERLVHQRGDVDRASLVRRAHQGHRRLAGS